MLFKFLGMAFALLVVGTFAAAIFGSILPFIVIGATIWALFHVIKGAVG
jgi:hypothetical protein